MERFTEAELHAFLDGQLPPERMDALREAIEADPAAASYAADRDALRAAFAPVADLPVPDRLLRAATMPPPALQAKAAPWARRSVLAGLAAAAAAGVAYVALPSGEADPLVGAALAARQGEPDRVIAENDAGPALSAAFGARIRVPDLQHAGYKLERASFHGRGAELRYRSAEGALFTLYLAKSRGEDRFALIERRRLRICVWENDDLAAVMAADLPRATLFRLASLAYAALNA